MVLLIWNHVDDQLLSVSDTSMPAEERINSIILLKHTLEKIAPILEASEKDVAQGSYCQFRTYFLRSKITLVMLGSKDTCSYRPHQGSDQRRRHLGQGCVGPPSPKMLCGQSTSIIIDADGQSGVNGLLDVARQNFKEVTSDVFTLIDAYKSISFLIAQLIQVNMIYPSI